MNDIERFPFSAFPQGIYAIAFSNEVKCNKINMVEWKNNFLKIWRNNAGELHAEDNLEIFEKYGFIFLKDGLNELNLPKWDQTAWSLPYFHYFKIKSHPQEILENSVDKLHFYHVHQYASAKQLGSPKINGAEFEISFQLERSEGVFGLLDKAKKLKMQLDIHIYGLGLSQVIVTLPQYHLIAKQIVCPTPIDGKYIHIRALTSLKAPDQLQWVPKSIKRFFMNYLCKMAANGFLKDFLPDIQIWENKKYILHPKYLPNDGDFELYRTWAKQFYESC